jgi:hypothetical protein
MTNFTTLFFFCFFFYLPLSDLSNELNPQILLFFPPGNVFLFLPFLLLFKGKFLFVVLKNGGEKMGSFRNASVTIRRQTLKCFLRIRIEYYHAFRSRFPTMCGELVTFQHIIYRIYQSVYMYAVVWLAPLPQKASIHPFPPLRSSAKPPTGLCGHISRCGTDGARLGTAFGSAGSRSITDPADIMASTFIYSAHAYKSGDSQIQCRVSPSLSESLRVSPSLSESL